MVSLCFYNYKRAVRSGMKRHWLGELIKWRSNPTHVEMLFSDGRSFSSTLGYGFDGCRFANIAYSHPARWDIITIAVTPGQENRMLERANSLLGKKYDLFGMLGLATTLKILQPHRDKYWCSEAVAVVINGILLDLKSTEITPEQLYKECCEQ
jgi:hypothetical protein